MTREEAKEVLGDVSAYLASRASLENEMLAGHTFTDICNAIKALEQPRWISVSERLPEVNGQYLTTIEGIGYYNRIRSFTNSLHKIDKYKFSSKEAGWYFYDSECGYIEEADVIAWMPLPQPYTESEDEE